MVYFMRFVFVANVSFWTLCILILVLDIRGKVRKSVRNNFTEHSTRKKVETLINMRP